MTFSPNRYCEFISDFETKLSLRPEALAVRRAFMGESVLAFFRANPSAFAARFQFEFENNSMSWCGPPDQRSSILGDAHLGNFGTFQSNEKKTAWGISDFDHVMNYRAELDLARLATSIQLTARAQSLRKVDLAISEMIAAYVKATKEPKTPYLLENESTGPVRDLIAKVKLKGDAKFEKKYLNGGQLNFDENIEAVSPKTQGALSQVVSEVFLKQPALKLISAATSQGKGGSSLGLRRFLCLLKSSASTLHLVELKQLGPRLDAARNKIEIPDAKWVGTEIATQNAFGAHVTFENVPMLVREIQAQKDKLKDDDIASIDDFVCVAAHAGTVLGAQHQRRGWTEVNRKQLSAQLNKLSETLADETELAFKMFA